MKIKYKLILFLIGFTLMGSLFVAQSYALWIKEQKQERTNSISTGCFSVGFTENTSSINLINEYPKSDEQGLRNNPYTFTITNTCTVNIAYSVTLNSLTTNTIDDSKIKFAIYESGENKPNSGTNLGTFGSTPSNINLETSSLGIANLKTSYILKTGILNGGKRRENEVISGGETKSYNLNLWIDSSAGNEVMEKTFEASIAINNVATSLVSDYQDGVIAQAPELYTGMIPVKFEGSTLKSANSKEKYYDYSTHEWANAVLVNYEDTTIRNKYFNEDMSVKENVTIDVANDVLQMYVWIPRYRYKLWNAENGTSEPQAIEIEFIEKSVRNTVGKTEEEYKNNEWYVHPAFTFGTTELSGIWVGKFEMTGSESIPTIKPNSQSLTYLTVSQMFNSLQSMTYAKYGIDKTKVDTHMMKNSEWGAVAYLSHSIYGRYEIVNSTTQCISSGCEVWINNVNTGYGNLGSAQYSGQPQNGPSITGCAGTGLSVAQNPNKSACEDGYEWLNLGVNASTTGNVTGIYDMSGGAWEYVMGVMYESDNTTPRYYSSGFTAGTMPDSKYYETYTYQESANNNVFNRYHLGDATRETLRSLTEGANSWYNDCNYTVYSSNPWVIRGSDYDYGSGAGLFSFHRAHGGALSYYSFRSVLSAAK